MVVLFVVLSNGIRILYWAAHRPLPAGEVLLVAALGIFVFWRWLDAECAPHGVTFPLDIGYFLYMAGFALLPYYFWRTQRWRGLAKLLALAGVWMVSYAAWIGIAGLLSSIAQ
jgi:hypothetical protein